MIKRFKKDTESKKEKKIDITITCTKSVYI